MGGIDGTRLTKRLARACVLRDTRRVPENTLASVTKVIAQWDDGRLLRPATCARRSNGDHSNHRRSH